MATKKRYNFKGLDEIFGESVTDLVGSLEDDTEKAKELASTVAISTLQPNPFQPRKIFSDVEIQELSDSIKQNGIIQPIIVNEVAKNSYQIVAGERRYRAAKLANLKEVPVVIAKLDSKQMEEFAIIENIQRVDLTDIEEAVAYKQLAKSLNLKQDEIAKRVGKSRSHVANILRLVNLPQYIQDAMLQKEISMGQAKPLLSILSNEKLLKEVFDRIVANNLTARDVEQLIKKITKW
jgi:ParB family chromosome partitioning protein